MNFLLRKLFRNSIEPEKEAKFLMKIVSGSAYKVFLDKHFRKLVNFENQSQTEQDRIFNELVVTGLILLVSAIQENLSRIEAARQEFWQAVCEKIPEIFTNWLAELKIQKDFVDIWQKLIDLRDAEYRENQIETRQAWAEEIIKGRDNEKSVDTMVRVETLTVSSMLHITRGRARPKDPLQKYLRTWVGALNNKLEKRIGW